MNLPQRCLSGFLLLLTVCIHCKATTTIPQPPTMISQPPRELLYGIEEKFLLECIADGNPEPEYRWMKNGEEFDYISESDRITQQPGTGRLLFTKPDDVDEGFYQCFAENVHGTSVSNTVHLMKFGLNSFPDENPKEVHVTEGQPLTLGCNPPTGIPKPTVFWIRQLSFGALFQITSPRIPVDPEGNLHFSYVTDDDGVDDMLYVCRATSIYLDEMGSKIILVVEPSPTPDIQTYPVTKQYTSPSNIVALRGGKLELNCIYGGKPVPVITWHKKGGTLPSTSVFYANYRRTLKIDSVDFQDDGSYECTASNGVGSPQTHTMTVTVQSAPTWLNVPNNTNAAEDETVSFKCLASGIPAPQVEWFINGVPIKDVEKNPRRKLDSTGNVLTIESLVKSDTAVFQCNASNTHGYAFHNFYLNVLALPPTIIERPDPVITVVNSTTTTLKCRVFGVPKPKVKWLRDEQELKGDRFQVLENGDLKITDVYKQDAGDYACYASNKFGDDAAVTMLEVKDKTTIVEPPENSEVADGRCATFRCSAVTDSDLELKIEWMFNGEPIELYPRMVQAVDNTFIITRTERSDSGVYTCVAKTELDQAEASATLTVQASPPTIVESPDPFATAVVNSKITLKCRVSGVPKPEVNWQRDRRTLKGDRFQVLENGDLEINDVSKRDEGEYKCHASNKYGNEVAIGRLQVKDKTKIVEPPENYEAAGGKCAVFRCNAVTDDDLELNIEWLFNGKPIDFVLDPRMVQAEDNTLIITRTAEGDSGVYTCVAKTELDQDDASATLTVQG